jgi:class 3 adenylate cyclase
LELRAKQKPPCERSKNRLANEAKRLDNSGLTVTRLTREMDLSNLATTDTRLVTGVHLYADITNLDELLLDPVQQRDDYRRIYRTLHLTRRELRRIIQSVFGGDKIQVQGPKFHGLLFRPYNDPETMATDAVMAALTIDAALTSAFSAVFPSYPELIPAIGLDLGDCLVANIGMRSDRELISVGNAANNAAKILRGNRISIGTILYDTLPSDIQDWFTKNGKNYRLDPSTINDLETLIADEGYNWTLQSSVDNYATDADNLLLGDISIEDVREKIDVERLGPLRAKTCNAASIFVDLDGYTKLVDDLDGDTDALLQAVKLLHLFRYELRQVTENDYGGVSLQHQGDRLQALYHDPKSDDNRVREAAVDLAIAYNSSVEEVINAHHKNIVGKVHVAIGSAFGKALVGKLGTKGDMDPVCIGKATSSAENLQLGVHGNTLAITPRMHEAITDDTTADQFTKHDEGHYEATGITFVFLEDVEDTTIAKTATAAAYTSTGAITMALRAPATSTPLHVTRPYAP